MKRFFRPKLGDLQKKKIFTQIQAVFLTNFRCGPEIKNCTFLVQITASPSQLLIANPIGGLFSFLEQKSASNALKTWYFAYFSGQWGLDPPLLWLPVRAKSPKQGNNYMLFTKLLWPGDSEGIYRSSSWAATCLPNTVEASHSRGVFRGGHWAMPLFGVPVMHNYLRIVRKIESCSPILWNLGRKTG